jgi:polyhydroxyalkanoate synthesis regulator phasin
VKISTEVEKSATGKGSAYTLIRKEVALLIFHQDDLVNNPVSFSEERIVESSGIIQTPVKNLSSKIDSILRSIQNLTEKKVRIEYEIRKQKASLTRKRSELKKAQKSTSRRIKISLESSDPTQQSKTEELQNFQKQVSKLLEESARVLDEP